MPVMHGHAKPNGYTVRVGQASSLGALRGAAASPHLVTPRSGQRRQ